MHHWEKEEHLPILSAQTPSPCLMHSKKVSEWSEKGQGIEKKHKYSSKDRELTQEDFHHSFPQSWLSHLTPPPCLVKEEGELWIYQAIVKQQYWCTGQNIQQEDKTEIKRSRRDESWAQAYIQLPSMDGARSMEHVPHPVVVEHSLKHPQGKIMFVPLP